MIDLLFYAAGAGVLLDQFFRWHEVNRFTQSAGDRIVRKILQNTRGGATC